MMRSCFLFGHRDTPQGLKPEIENAVERHYQQYGVRCFYVGCYGAFDRMAVSAVKAVKSRHRDIVLNLLLPYHPAERTVSVPEGVDGTFYPLVEKVPRRYAIVKANRFMIKSCDTIICYVKHTGNARELLECARRLEKRGIIHVENLAEEV